MLCQKVGPEASKPEEDDDPMDQSLLHEFERVGARRLDEPTIVQGARRMPPSGEVRADLGSGGQGKAVMPYSGDS